MKSIDQVEQFHKAFGHPVSDAPYINNEPLNRLRMKLLWEELEELQIALDARDTVEVLDALCDLQYVLDGAFLALGFGKVKEAAFTEVHLSNMSKLGEDGKPVLREDQKVLKGPNFREPNLKQFVG